MVTGQCGRNFKANHGQDTRTGKWIGSIPRPESLQDDCLRVNAYKLPEIRLEVLLIPVGITLITKASGILSEVVVHLHLSVKALIKLFQICQRLVSKACHLFVVSTRFRLGQDVEIGRRHRHIRSNEFRIVARCALEAFTGFLPRALLGCCALLSLLLRPLLGKSAFLGLTPLALFCFDPSCFLGLLLPLSLFLPLSLRLPLGLYVER